MRGVLIIVAIYLAIMFGRISPISLFFSNHSANRREGCDSQAYPVREWSIGVVDSEITNRATNRSRGNLYFAFLWERRSRGQMVAAEAELGTDVLSKSGNELSRIRRQHRTGAIERIAPAALAAFDELRRMQTNGRLCFSA